MKKQFNIKVKLFMVLVFFILFLFRENLVFSVKTTGLYTNDDKPNADISSISAGSKFKLTYYGGGTLGSKNPQGKAFTASDFTKNSKYGWCEYTYNNQKYVVLAAAAYSLFDDSSGPYTWYDYIHYFKVGWKYNTQYDTIQFKFADSNFDSAVYNGIILDECGESMRTGKNDPQILDVYMGTNGENDSTNGQKFNQKKVLVTDTGVFTSNASMNSNGNGIVDIGIFICELFSSFFNNTGDVIQKTLVSFIEWKDIFQTGKNTYAKSEIESNTALQKLINVQEGQSENDFKNFKDENIYCKANVNAFINDKNGNQKTVYTEDTPIPVTPMDLYSMSTDKHDCFEIDFFNRSQTNTHPIWKLVNSIVSLWAHIMLYLCAAILIGLLIWRSILFISSTYMGNVIKTVTSKQMMDDWVKSIVLILSVFVIMPTIILFYKNLLKIILNGNNSIYLIRVNVENIYQFNTNITGYLKYMTLISDNLLAFGYSLLYVIFEFMNLVWFTFMASRVIVLGFLTIVSPITAINTMTKKIPSGGRIRKNLYFKNWIKSYILWTFCPIFIIIIHRITLMIA